MLISIDVQERPVFRHEHIYYLKGDITDGPAFHEMILEIRPDAVFNTAAYTHVDGCETDREAAFRLNVTGAENVAKACRDVPCRMIHLSTDYVFDGKAGPYSETDPVHPISYYGETKLESERIALRLCADSLIVRTMVLYGTGPALRPNFVTWLVGELRNGRSVNIVDGQYGNATLADDLAAALICLYEKDKRGIYHAAGKGLFSRYELALRIARVFGLDETLIRKIPGSALRQPATRPERSWLKTEKLAKETGYSFLDVDEALRIMKEQMETVQRDLP